jgi:uncharacterized protein (TIGR02246 family)
MYREKFMNLIKLTIAGMVAVALTGCTPPEPKKEAPLVDPSSAAAADPTVIDKTRSEFIAAFNAADVTKLVEVYAPDAVLMPSHQPVISGRAAIEDYDKKFFETYTAKLTIMPVETKVFGDRGLDRGTYTIELTPKAGGPTVKDEGKYLVLLQRQADGSWKLTHDIDNTNMPAPPPPAAKTETKKK